MTSMTKVPVKSEAIWVVAPVAAASRERVMEPKPMSEPRQSELHRFAKPRAHSSRFGLIG